DASHVFMYSRTVSLLGSTAVPFAFAAIAFTSFSSASFLVGYVPTVICLRLPVLGSGSPGMRTFHDTPYWFLRFLMLPLIAIAPFVAHRAAPAATARA